MLTQPHPGSRSSWPLGNTAGKATIEYRGGAVINLSLNAIHLALVQPCLSWLNSHFDFLPDTILAHFRSWVLLSYLPPESSRRWILHPSLCVWSLVLSWLRLTFSESLALLTPALRHSFKPSFWELCFSVINDFLRYFCSFRLPSPMVNFPLFTSEIQLSFASCLGPTHLINSAF